MKLNIWLFCLIYLTFTAKSYATEDFQSHESINRAVYQFLASTIQQDKQDYEIKVRHLDRRLKLNQCETPLEPFLPSSKRNSGKITVGVRCQGKKPWTLYLSAAVKNFQAIAVLNKPLPRGAIVSEDDIHLERKNVSNLHRGYLTKIEQIVNKQIKRTLPKGAILNSVNLIPQKLVKRGQLVSIRAIGELIDIRMSGHALMDGEAGQQIRVRNTNSKRIIEGKVIAPGAIMVNL